MPDLKFHYFGVNLELIWDDSCSDLPFNELLLPIWQNDPSLMATATFRILPAAEGELVIEGPANEPSRSRRQYLMDDLERRIHFYLANNCQQVVFVHAGAVCWQGRVLLIPGRSFSGKSTLVHYLVEAGATYLSDEFAVVTPAGLVHPFPRPIALRPEGGQRIVPERIALKPLPLSAVLVTQYQEDTHWQPQLLSQGQAVLELMQNTVTARSQAALALECLTACTHNIMAWSGARGEAMETVSLILERLQQFSVSPT